MKILTVTFSIEGDNHLKQGPAIEHQGMLWLVVGWIENQAQGYAKPKRLIALDPFRLQRFPQTTFVGDAATNLPIPKALFADPIPSPIAGKFPVLERPDIKIPGSSFPTMQ